MAEKGGVRWARSREVGAWGGYMTRRITWLLVCLAITLAFGAAELTRRWVMSAVREAIEETVAPKINAAIKETAITRRLIERDATDIDAARRKRAALEAAELVDRHMRHASSFSDRSSLLRASLAAVDPKLDGLYCEFGVAGGISINFIASLVTQQVHGFDSFEGLPEDWVRGLSQGELSINVVKGAFKGTLPQVRTNVVLHKGWFHETLPKFRQEYLKPLAFAHMDADLYSSTRTVLDLMADRIVPGTILQFDEYFNYPGWQQHEYRAFTEFVERHGVKYEFIGYCRRGEQVAVKIVGKRASAKAH